MFFVVTRLFPFLTFFCNDSLCLLRLFDVQLRFLRRNKYAGKSRTPFPSILQVLQWALLTIGDTTDISCMVSASRRSAMLYKASCRSRWALSSSSESSRGLPRSLRDFLQCKHEPSSQDLGNRMNPINMYCDYNLNAHMLVDVEGNCCEVVGSNNFPRHFFLLIPIPEIRRSSSNFKFT